MHYITLLFPIYLATIKHYYLASSCTALILCPYFILYCRITAYYSFSSTLRAIILKTPVLVTRATRSPRKLAQIRP